MRLSKKIAFLVFIALFWPSSSFAGGYAILEQSAEGIGVSFAGQSAGYGDGSEVSLNPAAMSWIDSPTVSAGLHIIVPSAEFSDNGSTLVTSAPIGGGNGPDGGETAYVPNLYGVYPLNDKLTLGLGITPKFGLATKYDSTWVGRYFAVKSELTNIDIIPAVSYKVTDNFSLGASLNVHYLDAELTNAVDFGTIGFGQLGPTLATSLGLLPGQADGFAKLSGDDWAVGGTFGASYRYSEDGVVGIVFNTKVNSTLTGSADFTVPANAAVLTSSGFFTDTSGSASLTLPESLSFGIAHNVSDNIQLLGELVWTRWSRFKELRAKFGNGQPDSVVDEGWNNTWRVSVGGRYQASDNLRVSAGLGYDQTPIADAQHRTPRIPGNDRRWVSLGLDYLFTENFKFSLNYGHIFVSDASTDILDSLGNRLVGDWDLSVDLISASLVWRL
ncbi:MAG: transporter [Candidatus Dadabacteria bacterium]|nr:MAG: transporter [Candidatus Dadabacteria bacterium]